MSYTPKTRDRYRLAVATVSGVTTFVALTATGLIAGAAAQDYEAEQARKAADKLEAERAYQLAKKQRAALIRANNRYYTLLARQAENPRIVVRERRHLTHVTTQYLGSGGSGYVGSGGSVSGGTSSAGTSGTSSGGTSGTGSGGSAPPPPPPPPPPPAPSSGS